ncbi:23S rRNA (adenine2503-C2)-methyltransferase [Geothermobacter ehrlichii]|uniref:23S rRNA (Adenine2503-C2)-methyltransferase n=1 Tax=Geothermobacter ehrlichii TaxID=213224 RepID=A0A5D3WL39_9BACT|nr:radical SAM protein [Geothermobacter ehrlichii]TYO99161.1 23S rRNA (adenine2503-C2)-methyltransferase [Geothermobacter ehrlichii]
MVRHSEPIPCVMEETPNQRFAVALADGLRVEAVWYASGTLCISSQAGCALGCPFCASGRGGLRRNLTLAELEQQVEQARNLGLAPRRLTLSGIGEPLHNLATVRRFIETCRARQLPVSLTTTGTPLAKLREALRLPHNGLMLSLHAGSTATHRRLVPRGPDYDALWELLDRELPRLSRRNRRRIGINYLLLAGENDSAEELDRLARRLAPHPELTLHLLVCNPVPDSPFRSPPQESIDAIHTRLRAAGIQVRRANRWRRQQEGGCGTLVLRH